MADERKLEPVAGDAAAEARGSGPRDAAAIAALRVAVALERIADALESLRIVDDEALLGDSGDSAARPRRALEPDEGGAGPEEGANDPELAAYLRDLHGSPP